MKKRYGYRVFKRYVRLLLNHILYRKHYVIGKENLPAVGEPYLIPANHNNPAIDPISMVLSQPQPLHPYVLAMGGVFGWHKLIDALWDWVGMLPAFRMDFEGVDEALKRTKYVIDFAASKMTEGYPVMLFPEMNHHVEHWMRVWQQGDLEIAFLAAEKLDFKKDVKIIPTALHYSSYYGAQGEYLIHYGEPFSLQPYYEQYKQKPRTTMREINPILRKRVMDMMLCTEDQEHHDLYDFLRQTKFADEFALREVGKGRKHACSLPLPERLEADKHLWAAIEDGLQNKPEGKQLVDELDSTWKQIQKEEEKLCLRPHAGEQKRKSLPALLGASLVQLALLPLWIVALYPSALMYYVPPMFMPDKEDSYYKVYTQSLQLILTVLIVLPVFGLATLLVMGLVWGWWWPAVVWILLWLPLAVFAWYTGSWMRRTLEQWILRFHKKKASLLTEHYEKLYSLMNQLIRK